MEVRYNESIEVSVMLYVMFQKYFAGVCAFRQEGNKYYIRCWHMKYAKDNNEVCGLW